MDDFEKLPLMTKDDIRQYNEELCTVGPTDVREVFTTSGTTGEPVVFRYGQQDVSRLARQAGDLLGVAGVERGDLFPADAADGYLDVDRGHLLLAGIPETRGGYAAIRSWRLGGAAGECDPVQRDRLLRHRELRGAPRPGGQGQQPDRPAADPQTAGRQREHSHHRAWAQRDGRLLESLWPNATISAVYGNTEFGFSGAECSARQGFHTHPGMHYFEVVDPQTSKPLADGEVGRLVATGLRFRGLPLIRYCIDDVTFMKRGMCDCGRISERFGPIIGRLDQMIKIKGGVSFYPAAIENLMVSIRSWKTTSSRSVPTTYGVTSCTCSWRWAPRVRRRGSREYPRRFQDENEVPTRGPQREPRPGRAPDDRSGKRKPQRFFDLRNG